MAQRSIRFPDELHDAIDAEAERRGKPHTFSSVLIEAAGNGMRALEAALGSGEVASEPRPEHDARANGSPQVPAASPAPASPRAPTTRQPVAAMGKGYVRPIPKGGKR